MFFDLVSDSMPGPTPPYSRPAGFATGGRSARGYGNPILDKSVDQPYQSMCRRLLFRSEKDESRTRTPKGQTVYLFIYL
jgi:hypothetical protein